ncbi:Ricin-type beta-trefoil lectin domain protein [Streptomyces sp. YIM 130001]|uniref:RICIN domain-containing protein n=1 Tax=Streptomyces sp. YIM 130001 TaxID=2259644 RepID=UPI000E647585|nr:RICIN domain-containing protein [Streptomyces sp. YIM 130001]RII15090.1 Ricin-type beta-trefoil lectin domain protein [Streptomyces sp. YIM 130001]
MSRHSRTGAGGGIRGAGPELGAGGGQYADSPDLVLARLLRRDVTTAFAAARELRRRHLPAALAYADVCTLTPGSARLLAAQSFARAVQEAKRGIEPPGAWRHRLLLLVARAATAWSADERSVRLEPEVVPRDPAVVPSPQLLDAVRRLPLRTQAVLWYAEVDEEPDTVTAGYLGIRADEVAQMRDAAPGALRSALLASRIAAHGGPDCRGHLRLLENAVLPRGPRYSADLEVHLADCACCGDARAELLRLNATPRAVLADGLLPWGGDRYALAPRPSAARGSRRRGAPAPASGPTTAAGRTTRPRGAGPGSGPGSGSAAGTARPDARGSDATPAAGAALEGAGRFASESGRMPRGFVLGAVVLGVTLAPLTLLLLTTGSPDDDTGPRGNGPGPSTALPDPGMTVTPPPTPQAPPASAASYRHGDFTQLVNAGTGLCLDIEDGALEERTDVVAVKCSASDTQRWRVDIGRGVIQSHADPDFCLDSRGAPGLGVGIADCAPAEDGAADLSFTVNAAGTVRAVSVPGHVLTPRNDDAGSDVILRESDSGPDQRWRAGKSPV